MGFVLVFVSIACCGSILLARRYESSVDRDSGLLPNALSVGFLIWSGIGGEISDDGSKSEVSCATCCALAGTSAVAGLLTAE